MLKITEEYTEQGTEQIKGKYIGNSGVIYNFYTLGDEPRVFVFTYEFGNTIKTEVKHIFGLRLDYTEGIKAFFYNSLKD